MEISQRRGAHLDSVNDDAIVSNLNPELEEDQDEARLLRLLTRDNAKLVVELVPYDGKWI